MDKLHSARTALCMLLKRKYPHLSREERQIMILAACAR